MRIVDMRIRFFVRGVFRPRFWSADVRSRKTKVVNVYEFGLVERILGSRENARERLTIV